MKSLKLIFTGKIICLLNLLIIHMNTIQNTHIIDMYVSEDKIDFLFLINMIQ